MFIILSRWLRPDITSSVAKASGRTTPSSGTASALLFFTDSASLMISEDRSTGGIANTLAVAYLVPFPFRTVYHFFSRSTAVVRGEVRAGGLGYGISVSFDKIIEGFSGHGSKILDGVGSFRETVRELQEELLRVRPHLYHRS